jgi:hypothetical protein
MFAASPLGGAPWWRPAMWIYGRAQTGKSTLLATLEALAGGFFLTSEDTTGGSVVADGLRQFAFGS